MQDRVKDLCMTKHKMIVKIKENRMQCIQNTHEISPVVFHDRVRDVDNLVLESCIDKNLL